MKPLFKLQAFARSLGSDVRGIKYQEFDANYGCPILRPKNNPDFAVCPFEESAGMILSQRVVVYAKGCFVHWATVIHELAHCLATPKNPDEVDHELDFFGWEIAVVEHVLGYARDDSHFKEWERQNKAYGLGLADDSSELILGNLTYDEKTILYAESRAFAEEEGLTVKGVPVRVA